MAGQPREAIAGGNLPDCDGLLFAAAGDKLAVGRKSDGIDTVIETSQHMKHTDREEKHGKKNVPARVAGRNGRWKCPRF